ncbi:MAG: nucleotide-binding protein [Neisseriaceae bacterium]|nr:nucleotide-binding protein [Neisseriaceae bacterium]
MSDLDKLKDLIQQADKLLAQEVTNSLPEFKVWRLNVQRFLEHKFGKDSTETQFFNHKIYFSSIFSETEDKEISICKKGITETKLILETYLEEMEESQNSLNENKDNRNIDLTKVFIVHGHNDAIKEKVARLVEKQGLEAIILGEQTGGSKTIIERLEYHINEQGIGAAICLFTADDTGKANKEEDYKSRARQNVVFETGWCIGKLGRERIVVIAENTENDKIELPSDMQGVVYINKNWEVDMLKELRNMGFKIDLNKI